MAAHRGKLALILLLTVAIFTPRVAGDSLKQVVSEREQDRLKQLLTTESNWRDLHTSYLSVKGLESVGASITREISDKACSSIETPEELESIFYASSLSKSLGKNCKVTISGVDSTLKGHLKEDATVTTLYYAVLSLSNFDISFDKAKALSLLKAALDSDDTPFSAGLAFKVAAVLHSKEIDVSSLFDSIEDIINQADEADTTLNFDSGLAVTSTVIVGSFELATAVGKAPVISEEQIIKLGNYLVVNRHTGSVEDASYVLQGLGTLAKNKYLRPTALLLASNRPVTNGNPQLKVRFTDILDKPLGKASVKASIDDPDGENILTKKQFNIDVDKITYSISLYPNVVQPGVYNVQLSAILQGDSAAFDIPDATMMVTVSQSVTVKKSKLSILDREQGVSTKDLDLQYPQKVTESLSADFHQKLHMTFFVLGNMHDEPIKVHQAFVMLKKKQQEVFFVATADENNQYTFDLDVNAAGKESFGYMSGTYKMSLIIGDFAAENSFVWDIGSIDLKFSGEPVAKKDKESRQPKPEIIHMYREPDKRASKTMSTLFTVLTLLPILFLLALWLGLGANISNLFDSGIWGILFQLGLVGMFSLFFLFWLQLNMFETLWYLGLLGAFTFFAGNRMLRSKTSQKKT
ncbi:dolichyl-diphosphooligosaccharide--protein glycosyltransferase subunit 2-like [Dysidea avara]|uniref:dolichyl-diphosphooligosaccharide--protein glycosyltransferase subunit 2-like n=1 Tax=Dysidea avara TaxID=196820 RepID=UPI003331A11B